MITKRLTKMRRIFARDRCHRRRSLPRSRREDIHAGLARVSRFTEHRRVYDTYEAPSDDGPDDERPAPGDEHFICCHVATMTMPTLARRPVARLAAASVRTLQPSADQLPPTARVARPCRNADFTSFHTTALFAVISFTMM